jgi:hypothetical protein
MARGINFLLRKSRPSSMPRPCTEVAEKVVGLGRDKANQATSGRNKTACSPVKCTLERAAQNANHLPALSFCCRIV